MTWRLWWEHTSMLVEEAHGGTDANIAEISRDEVEQITAGLAARNWRPTQPGCPGWPAPTRDDTAQHSAGATRETPDRRKGGQREWARSTGSGIRTGHSRR